MRKWICVVRPQRKKKSLIFPQLNFWTKILTGELSEPQSCELSIKVALIPTLNCDSGLNLMNYGQYNIISPIISL